MFNLFGSLDNLGYDFSTMKGIVKIKKGALVVMKAKKVKKTYTF